MFNVFADISEPPNTATVDSQHDSLLSMIVSLQRKLDQKSIGDAERQFYSHGLTYLTTQSGKQVQVEHWMITEFEVELTEKIAIGGL
jgi:hypothetical protein